MMAEELAGAQAPDEAPDEAGAPPRSLREALEGAFDAVGTAPDEAGAESPAHVPDAPDAETSAQAGAPPAPAVADARADAEARRGAERLGRLEAVLAPRRERFQLAGLDEAQAVQQLLAAHDFLERDPVGALAYLGRQSGVDWNELARRVQGAPGQTPAQAQIQASALEPLAAEVASLSQAFARREAREAEASARTHLAAVDAFAADPGRVHLGAASERMSQLLRLGAATTLEEAYEQACWADPRLRPRMIEAESQARAAAAGSAARAAGLATAAAARHASGSVTGAPTPGARPGAAPSLREELSRAFDAFAA
ncbi:MAG TPA: hypothetical protein VMU93_07430 [Caulobacteraceae bacterium]|nr:hypothetical protein [Caulobacteraceae bacterium]